MVSFLKPGVKPDPVSSQQPFIPRILWQTSKDRRKILPELIGCIEKLRKTNPTWEHRLFDDETQLLMLNEVCSDRFLKAYSRIQPRYGAAKADLFRYVAVYLYGGAYLDLKSGTTRPLDDILQPDDRFIISQWDNGPDGMFPGVGTRKTLKVPGGEYEQWFVIAEPGHPFLAAVIEKAIENIENYNPFVFGHGGKGVLNVMGPNHYTVTIRSLEKKHHTRHICAWAAGLRYTMLDDLNAHQKLDTEHYGHILLPPVTSKGLKGAAWFRLKALEILFWPFASLRGLNSKRLKRHYARKAARTAQTDL